MQYSLPIINARLDVIETIIGPSPRLLIYTGAKPANCAAPATGTLLNRMLLPVDYMIAASGGQKLKNGVWTGDAIAAGVQGYFRLLDTAELVAHIQGTIGLATDIPLPDLVVDELNVALNQTMTFAGWSITGGNA